MKTYQQGHDFKILKRKTRQPGFQFWMSQGWTFSHCSKEGFNCFVVKKWGFNVRPGEHAGKPVTGNSEFRGPPWPWEIIRWRNPETLKPFPKICGETIKSDDHLMIFLAVGYTLPPWDGSEPREPSGRSTDWAQPTRDVGFIGLGTWIIVQNLSRIFEWKHEFRWCFEVLCFILTWHLGRILPIWRFFKCV